MEIKLDKPTIESVTEAWETLKVKTNENRLRMRITFDSPIAITVGTRKRSTVTTIDAWFFMSSNERLCYALRSNYRVGWPISSDIAQRIVKIETLEKIELTEQERETKVKQFLNHFSLNLWENIQQKLSLDPQCFKTSYYDNFEAVYLNRWFNEMEIKHLANIISEKKNYSTVDYGQRCTMRLELKVGDDGVYRGWLSFNSNTNLPDRCYILASSTVAVLCERD